MKWWFVIGIVIIAAYSFWLGFKAGRKQIEDERQESEP